MEGFLDIKAVSNLTGYTVDDIKHFVDNKQIPHISWPDGKVIFPTRDIEKWLKTHKPQKPAVAPKATAGWPDEPPPEFSSATLPARDQDPAGPPANLKEDARKAKRVAAAAKAKATRAAKK